MKSADAQSSHAGELLSRAWREYGFQNWAMAERLFAKALKESSLDPEQRADAMYGTAMLHHHRIPGADFEKAKEIYEEICLKYPESPLVPWCRLSLARIAEGSPTAGKTSAAYKLYMEIIRQYQGHLVAEEALLRICLLKAQFDDRDATSQACLELEAELKRRPDMPFAAAAHLLLGDIYLFPLKNYPKALEHYLATDQIGLNEPLREPMLYYQIAKIARTQLDRPEIAMKYLEKLIIKFPRDMNVYRGKLELAELKKQHNE